MLNNKALTVMLAPAIVFLAGCDIEALVDSSRYKEDFSYSYPLEPGGKVSVESFNGSIEIFSWEKDVVQITGTKFASTQGLLDSIKIDVVATDTSVRIRTSRPFERRGSMGAKYVIRVPAKTELERVITSNGTIRVEAIEGPVRLRTTNGGIRVFGVQGPLEATTTNAGVDVQELNGSVTLRTTNGAIKADGVRGFFEASTSNGGIEARLVETEGGRPVKADTSNGNIDLSIESFKGNDVIATTSNASITVRLPRDAAANVRASTSNAFIKTDFEVATSGSISKNHLQGTINGGGPRLDLSTSNGSIHIVRMDSK